MQEYDFVKLNGLGNDFIFIEDMDEKISLEDAEVKALCDRHFGIGADGVILVRPPKVDGLAYMHYINSDGTLAQMCGNGVRCFAKYLVDRGFVDGDSNQLIAETLAGPKKINFTRDAAGKLEMASVDMGKPILDPRLVPVNAETNAESPFGEPYVRELPIDSPWGKFKFTMVSMGNPHAVTFIDDWQELPDACFVDPSNKSLSTFDVDLIGAYFEGCEAFPERSNIEFAEIDDNGISMRVYERGCAETLACGTGTCATSVAATLLGLAGCKNDVNLLGGNLTIDWRDDGHVVMTGPAEESFTGTVSI